MDGDFGNGASGLQLDASSASASDNSYRMVRKEYFCFICDKKFKKMVQVQELLDKGLTCDECGQGFVEVIEHGNDMPLRDFVEKVSTLDKRTEVDSSASQFAVNTTSMLDRLQNASVP